MYSHAARQFNSKEVATEPPSREKHELDQQAKDGRSVPELQQLQVGLQVGHGRLQVAVDAPDLGLHAVDVKFEIELGSEILTASDGTRGRLGKVFLNVGGPERVVDPQ